MKENTSSHFLGWVTILERIEVLWKTGHAANVQFATVFGHFASILGQLARFKSRYVIKQLIKD